MNTAETTATTGSPPAEVTVIMSTFNGSAFLEQQLDSLYEQTHPNVRIMVRDDGSTDTTRSILERERSAGRIELLAGHNNFGAAHSFFELLQQAASTQTDFVAFCDQDDVWLPEKLSRAAAALSAIRNERAAMCCSRVEIVGADLAHVGFTPMPRRIGFGNALVENVTIGCSIVLNRKAVDLIRQNLPARVLVHDWWCYAVLSCFGEIIFDRGAFVKYRQHGSNAFGAATGKRDRLKRNLHRFAGGSAGRHWQSEQASVFLTAFDGRIPTSHRQVLNNFVEAKASWWRRIQLALSSDIWRQKRIDDFILRFLILINRF